MNLRIHEHHLKKEDTVTKIAITCQQWNLKKRKELKIFLLWILLLLDVHFAFNFFLVQFKRKAKLFTITAAVAHFFIFCLYFNFIYMKEFYNLAFTSIEGRCRVIDAFITCIFCMSINFQYAAIHTIHMSTTLFFIIAIQSIYLNRLTYLKCFRFW